MARGPRNGQDNMPDCAFYVDTYAPRGQPTSLAYAGLMTSVMISSRSSNGMNADFMAFTVSHCRSFQPQPNASASSTISRDIEVPLIRRLSVLTVTRKR